jgi:hypothetical protein
MRTTLIALSVGVAMLGGAGITQADTVVNPVAPIGQTAGQSKVAIAGQVRATGPLVLTDSQLEKLTAGHWVAGQGYIHGWRHGYFSVYYDGRCRIVSGSHRRNYC